MNLLIFSANWYNRVELMEKFPILGQMRQTIEPL